VHTDLNTLVYKRARSRVGVGGGWGRVDGEREREITWARVRSVAWWRHDDSVATAQGRTALARQDREKGSPSASAEAPARCCVLLFASAADYDALVAAADSGRAVNPGPRNYWLSTGI
jgi:hypothetical protein